MSEVPLCTAAVSVLTDVSPPHPPAQVFLQFDSAPKRGEL